MESQESTATAIENDPTKLDPNDIELLSKYYEEWSLAPDASSKVELVKSTNTVAERIPLFYEKPPPEIVDEDEDDNGSSGGGGASGGGSSSLRQKLREEARSLFLQKKSRELLDNTELKELWTLLDAHHTPPVVDEEKMINYKDFKLVSTEVCPKARPFFAAVVFAKLQQQDPFGRISILTFFNYVMRKTWLRQSRIGLSLYDMAGQGYLTEKDLELYISELIPTLPQLERLESSFMNFYICTAVRRFLFFLDPKHLGRVRIVDILASGFLDDLLELRDSAAAAGQQQKGDTSTGSTTSATAKDLFNNDSSFATMASSKSLEKNWFSAANALRVYGQYLNLDTDRNGLLSKTELKHYGSGMLTTTFIDRLYQECLTYDGEMDYKAYLDFVLAMENKKDSSSLQYFMRIVDVRQRGYLDGFAINYFFRAIQELLLAQDQPMVTIEDIKDEIFDMVKPRDPNKITVQDLVDSGYGDTVVNILTDLNGFWTYENREILATEQQQDEEAEC